MATHYAKGIPSGQAPTPNWFTHQIHALDWEVMRMPRYISGTVLCKLEQSRLFCGMSPIRGLVCLSAFGVAYAAIPRDIIGFCD